MSSTSAASDPRNGWTERFLESLSASGGDLVEDERGARIADFGSVRQEHRSLVDSAGLLEQLDRSLVRVQGPRATDMLDGLLTNHLAAATREARATYSFLLTAKGRPVTDLRVIPVGEEAFWLDLPAGAVADVEDHFSKYLPPRFAEHRREPTVFRISIVGPASAAALSGVSGHGELGSMDPLETARIELAGAEARVVRREPVEGPGFDLYLDGTALRASWDALVPAIQARGGRPAGRTGWDVLRAERGIPAFGSEITDDVLPQETGQEDRAISFDKGCYTGQEVVVRIQHRGHVNRHLRGLAFESTDGGRPAPVGSELYHGDRQVGQVTTAVSSPRLGPIALAYIRREVDPGDTLEVRTDAVDGARESDSAGEVPPDPTVAQVVELPFTES